MKGGDPRLYLDHILESIALVQSYVEGVELASFADDQEKQDAVVRRLEIMGEAVKNVPEEIRAKYPDVPWRRMAGMRDVLIHDYMGVDYELVWEVATSLLQSVRAQIDQIQQEIGGRGKSS